VKNFSGFKRGIKLRIPGSGRGVEIDAVGTGQLIKLASHIDDILDQIFGHLLVGFPGLPDFALGHQITGIGHRPVRDGVKSHVWHGPIHDRRNGLEHRLLHVGLFIGDHMLALLVAVVDMGQFQRIRAHSTLEHEQLLDLADGYMRPFDFRSHVVIGQTAFLALFHAHNPVFTFVKFQQIIDFVVGKGRYFCPVRCIPGPGLQILTDLGFICFETAAVSQSGE